MSGLFSYLFRTSDVCNLNAETVVAPIGKCTKFRLLDVRWLLLFLFLAYEYSVLYCTSIQSVYEHSSGSQKTYYAPIGPHIDLDVHVGNLCVARRKFLRPHKRNSD